MILVAWWRACFLLVFRHRSVEGSRPCVVGWLVLVCRWAGLFVCLFVYFLDPLFAVPADRVSSDDAMVAWPVSPLVLLTQWRSLSTSAEEPPTVVILAQNSTAVLC